MDDGAGCDSCLAHLVEWQEQKQRGDEFQKRVLKQSKQIRKLQKRLKKAMELLDMQDAMLTILADF